MRRTLFTLVAVLASTLTPGVASATPSQPRASGHGTSTTFGLEDFSFNARGTSIDADGRFKLTQDNSDLEPKTQYKGEVDCLKVTGNRAVLSGPITDVQPNDAEFADDELGFIAFAEDNGKGGGDQTPDRFAGALFFTASPGSEDLTCALVEGLLAFPIVDGDVKVEPAE